MFVPQNFSHLACVPAFSELRLDGFDFLGWPRNLLLSFSFFNGDGGRKGSEGLGKSYSGSIRRFMSNDRKWTNLLIAINILAYFAQIGTKGQLLVWGAKINGLIDKGEIWRLVTCSFLHANIGHLLINCYSLNSVGPAIEKISGPRRYIAVYMISAVASSAFSYWLSKAPAVGASGAIFGLVGSFAVFVMRHRGTVKGTEGDLTYIARVIALNMTIGILSKGIDNWGHLGGLLGGAATSWLLGPAWKVVSASDGKVVFADKAPIFSLVKRKKTTP